MTQNLSLNLDYLSQFDFALPDSDCLSALPKYQFPPNCTSNPTNISNPYYAWIIRHNISPFDLTQIFDMECEPFWAMGRLGQSKTLLPDGRLVLIGGEYEDFYDPQFYIYNDVIVKHPSGDIQIFSYPKSLFAPTDFHSATLIDDEIYIIGSMGYFNERHYQTTSVYKLNIHSFKITKIDAKNAIGWINNHTAILKDGQIIIQGGKILDDGDSPMRENIDEWAFNPKTLTFKNLTNHHWQGFVVERKDFNWLSLFDYYCLVFDQVYNPDEFDDKYNQLKDKLGIEPNLDLYEQLFVPPIAHYQDKDDDKAIWIDGIKVRFVNELGSLQVYVEGQLCDDKFDLLKENLCYKLSKLENYPCQIKTLPFHTPFGINKRAKKVKRL